MASLSRDDVEKVARDNGLGHVSFEERIALNTGRLMEVAYVGNRSLFAKRHSSSDMFHLCNEHRTLAPNDGEGPLTLSDSDLG